jgi:Bacterial regulatory helix-turn-helix protein, lysR family
MQISQIRYFLILCEERKFTRAAKRCGVSQPSLTGAIKRLEESLGGPLFIRTPGNLGLTELGRVVKPYLEQLNQSAHQARCKAEEFLRPPSVRPQPKAREPFMRAAHVIAVIAVVFVVGLGAKQLLFPLTKAEVGSSTTARPSMNVLEMHRQMNAKSLPALGMSDKAFIFTDEE